MIPLWMLAVLVALTILAGGALIGWLLRGEEHAANRQVDLKAGLERAAARGELHLDPRDDWFAH